MKTLDRWLKLLNAELEHTSDRSCAIVGACIIETLLLDLLKACLVACPTAKDEFFEGTNAPLGTFSARIDLAYRLGLISSQMTRDLHLVDKIRNEFAHRVEGPSFSEGGINSQVNELMRSLRLKERAPFLLTAPYNTPRGHFFMCAVMLIMFLDDRVQAGPKHIAPASLDYIYTTTITEGSKGAAT
jgi:hypothetical protein